MLLTASFTDLLSQLVAIGICQVGQHDQGTGGEGVVKQGSGAPTQLLRETSIERQG
jgi:hypothetical protein